MVLVGCAGGGTQRGWLGKSGWVTDSLWKVIDALIHAFTISSNRLAVFDELRD